MTKREEAHLFAVAASRPEFAFIYAYCLLSVNTSASGAELRGLRIIDVDLIGRTRPEQRTDFRQRTAGTTEAPSGVMT